MDTLELPAGRIVELGERTRGGSKNETRYALIGALPVVVKLQRSHGRLADEARALEFLADAEVRVPRVIASGTTPDGLPFLVISREEGADTRTPGGWARFGRDLARLADISIDGCPFPVVPAAQFTADHRARLDLVRPLLATALASEIDAAIALISATDRLLVTHGDPGTGNYLDSGRDDVPGVLLDWETASVSPFGLDLGRSAFIALLDLRGTGIPDLLAAAVIRGYLERSTLADELSEPVLRAWITIAGLQFIHGRHTQPLMPERTAEAAARVLADFVA
ncbi:aminoglycoside phosphotransferase family protein [Gryllotalpicola protaetiae]|uniref:Aminoglycoside phosphotransferase family protein n=1 Tax=Gryllotalpicola protaetiae TaxID=2419771 RepID=A0A387BKY8_9MICO|nr:aminoglycoside phosphotransferase family protein [Gryllotalpicola protaetiae]AYG03318.1 aminoglycoside phosphotransferase family protein [Gryllotalpicola protaetiae]